MTNESVEIVHAIYDHYSRGEMEAALQAFDPDVEWVPPPGSPTAKWHGQDGVRASMTDWADMFRSFRIETREFVEAGDLVLVSVRMTGRGRESELEIEADQFHVWTLRDSKAIRMEMFFVRDEAVRATGVEP